MGALEEFHAQNNIEFDFASLMAGDLQDMEAEFAGETVYKYYSSERRRFFEHPTVRFTQKTALNDPFELTRRWHEFGSTPTRGAIVAYLRSSLARLMARKDVLLAMLREHVAETGVIWGPAQEAAAAAILQTPAAEQLMAAQFAMADAMIGPLINHVFENLAANSDTMIEKLVGDIGIFSVSEIATNQPMWALYASSGKGFVVEFNAQHSFFHGKRNDGTAVNLLHKVKYTDARIPDFWQNPYYLFLVKGSNWSFEREWRMTRKLSECVPVTGLDGIYIQTVVPGTVKSVIFGYQYEKNNLDLDRKKILEFDKNVHLQIVTVNRTSGELELIPLD